MAREDQVILEDYALEMRGIVKYYGDLLVNDRADFFLKRGEVHAVLGENGSGKRTLVSILCGVKSCDAGEMYLYGEKVEIRNTHMAKLLGIVMVLWHMLLISKLSIIENIILGNEPIKLRFFIDLVKARRDIYVLMEQYAIEY